MKFAHQGFYNFYKLVEWIMADTLFTKCFSQEVGENICDPKIMSYLDLKQHHL